MEPTQNYTIQCRELYQQHVALVRYTSPRSEIAAGLGPAYGEIGGYLHELGMAHDNATIYMRLRDAATGVDVEAGFTVEGPVRERGRVQPGMLPGGLAAVTTHIGDYSGLPAAYDAVHAWIAANGYQPRDLPWEAYLTDPGETALELNRTEVVWPIF